MGRPQTISDEEILDAARAILLELGWSATAADVATRAGISEGSIFHRFKTKDELFRAAMLHDSDPPWIRGLTGRVGQGEVEEQLQQICTEAITFFRVLIPLVMLSWSKHPDDSRKHGLPGHQTAPIRAIKVISHYFESEMRLGRLRSHDPEVVARTVTGALWNFVSMEVLFDGNRQLPIAEATFVRSFVQLLFEGLAPLAPSRKGR